MTYVREIKLKITLNIRLILMIKDKKRTNENKIK